MPIFKSDNTLAGVRLIVLEGSIRCCACVCARCGIGQHPHRPLHFLLRRVRAAFEHPLHQNAQALRKRFMTRWEGWQRVAHWGPGTLMLVILAPRLVNVHDEPGSVTDRWIAAHRVDSR